MKNEKPKNHIITYTPYKKIIISTIFFCYYGDTIKLIVETFNFLIKITILNYFKYTKLYWY